MAKLYYRYGTVGSAKTLNLLAVAHNYQQQQKNVLLCKPSLDTRFGREKVVSRAGLMACADVLITEATVFRYQREPLTLEHYADPCIIDLEDWLPLSCVIVDEAQFLTEDLVNQLLRLTILADIPVICYGLKTNFQGKLFAGSKRLIEVADSIEEIKTTCHYCNRKATFNLKIQHGRPVCQGPEVELGCEEMYHPSCKFCYTKQLQKATSQNLEF